MAVVELIGLTKTYGGTPAVSQVDLKIASGEFFSLLGPSGCGKSTTLRMVAGFVVPDGGRILIDHDDITDRPPERRDIGIVFQNYAIFPHMNVHDNIAFGLKMRKVAREEIDRRVRHALQQVGLRGYEGRFQRALSGGQQQRVALARVLVTQPRILLLDEPLSALDKNLREEMQYWIKDLQKSLGITAIYVTHDQGEALTMSDRIGVMNRSRIVQVGTPREIYERPADLFVTTFIGDCNLLDGTVEQSTAQAIVVMLRDGQRIPAPPRPGFAAGEKVKLAVRPENVIIGAAPRDDRMAFSATVDAIIYQGALIRYRLSVGDQSIVAEVQNHADQLPHVPGAQVMLAWLPERSAVLALS